jgi:hypothetical protein
MANLRPKLQKLKPDKKERPLIVSPDLIHLFSDLGEKNYSAIILAVIVQRIAHMTVKTKPLNLEMQDYFDLFPFVDSRYLRKSVYTLRKYGIWKNKKYIPHSKMASYTTIKISFKAIAKLAKKIQKEQARNELKIMCQKINKEGGTKCYK